MLIGDTQKALKALGKLAHEISSNGGPLIELEPLPNLESKK